MTWEVVRFQLFRTQRLGKAKADTVTALVYVLRNGFQLFRTQRLGKVLCSGLEFSTCKSVSNYSELKGSVKALRISACATLDVVEVSNYSELKGSVKSSEWESAITEYAWLVSFQLFRTQRLGKVSMFHESKS